MDVSITFIEWKHQSHEVKVGAVFTYRNSQQYIHDAYMTRSDQETVPLRFYSVLASL
jgi:hypothetical protein